MVQMDLERTSSIFLFDKRREVHHFMSTLKSATPFVRTGDVTEYTKQN